MRLKLIACEVMARELMTVAARSPQRIDLELMPQGLHSLGSAGMRQKLQAAVDAVPAGECDAILLGYGLCGNGLVGLAARRTKLVVPRAHDCITLFLGSSGRYMEYFSAHPGVYYRTTGWIERMRDDERPGVLAPVDSATTQMSYEDLVAKFGEEDAKYIQEQLAPKPRHYGQITFIEMGTEPDSSFSGRAKEEAESKGWKFEKLTGDLGLLRALAGGTWDEERFLVVSPGQRIAPAYSERIIRAED